MKSDIVEGHASIMDFVYWMNERHSIYVKRFLRGESKPWTEDKILQRFRFTNVFRQLDTGTIALQKMLKRVAPEELVVFNVMWYRLFNLEAHAKFGAVLYFHGKESLYYYLRDRNSNGEKVFTSAHMTTGVGGEPKVETYIKACEDAWMDRQIIVEACKTNSMETVFKTLLQFYMVGPFVAYEMTCDLRFTYLLENATDKLTWANPGPGARRGLKRLGAPYKGRDAIQSMVKLYKTVYPKLSIHIQRGEWPFELREIEHSLCEFDKYQRVKTGVGRPRQKYEGI